MVSVRTRVTTTAPETRFDGGDAVLPPPFNNPMLSGADVTPMEILHLYRKNAILEARSSNSKLEARSSNSNAEDKTKSYGMVNKLAAELGGKMSQHKEIPVEIRSAFNWGAFFLTPFWGIRYEVWKAVIYFYRIFFRNITFNISSL